jgi:hypothetical protein
MRNLETHTHTLIQRGPNRAILAHSINPIPNHFNQSSCMALLLCNTLYALLVHTLHYILHIDVLVEVEVG